MSDEIEFLERQLMSALQARDMTSLEELLGEDFTLTTGRPGYEVRSREQWLEIASKDYVIEDYYFEELTVQQYRGCAVARSRYRQSGYMGELRRDTTYRMTDVWVRSDSGWQLQARHAQPVEGD